MQSDHIYNEGDGDEEIIPEINGDNNKNFEEHVEVKTFPIQITNPVKREGLKSYVVYTVIVNRRKEPKYRRYSDFYLLREKLIERWPGVYIPNIPPKKVVVRIIYSG
jgi:hypothetical protein